MTSNVPKNGHFPPVSVTLTVYVPANRPYTFTKTDGAFVNEMAKPWALPTDLQTTTQNSPGAHRGVGGGDQDRRLKIPCGGTIGVWNLPVKST